MPDGRSDYLIAHSAEPDDLARRLMAETQQLGAVAGMQISSDEGAFLAIVAGLVGATDAVEVGTFTGYSALCVARVLPDDGHLLCCDLSEEWTGMARRYWQEAGVAHKIDLRIAPAAETLRACPTAPTWDFAFIDADKTGYPVYWAEIVPRMRAGGAIVIDNVLLDGQVVDGRASGDDVFTMRRFNDQVVSDPRVEAVMLPIRDGVTLAWKR